MSFLSPSSLSSSSLTLDHSRQDRFFITRMSYKCEGACDNNSSSVKVIVHSKIKNSLIIYSPSCCCKTVWLSSIEHKSCLLHFFFFFNIQWKSVHSNIIFCVLQQRKKCSEDRIFILGWNSLIELNVCIVLFSYSSVKQNVQEKLQLWFNFTLKYSSIVIF